MADKAQDLVERIARIDNRRLNDADSLELFDHICQEARALRHLPCRCGVDVRDCTKGCVLFVCCGGYANEGHTSDCPGAHDETIGDAHDLECVKCKRPRLPGSDYCNVHAAAAALWKK